VTWWVQRHGSNPAGSGGRSALLLGDLTCGWRAGCAGSGSGSRADEVTSGEFVTPDPEPPRCSAVAAHAAVRDGLTGKQQAMGERGGLVAERPAIIGTCGFSPTLDLKVFLTASVAGACQAAAPLDLEQRDSPGFRSLNWRARMPNATVLIPVRNSSRSRQ